MNACLDFLPHKAALLMPPPPPSPPSPSPPPPPARRPFLPTQLYAPLLCINNNGLIFEMLARPENNETEMEDDRAGQLKGRRYG
ncbi:hypothetical protein E2C01_064590 [Portunus trituberculatus]|uniref:Uncharacterized protein n=1 Tax=Portunus trituberculatus TaxID=210409 RepID=A0A5B7HK63_PORTR|nr:hypothetical protein [Portunus trituberculatus]